MFTLTIIAYTSLLVVITAYIADMRDEAKERRI